LRVQADPIAGQRGTTLQASGGSSVRGLAAYTSVHVLLADPGASYHGLGPGYYEQCMHTRR